MKKLIAVLSIAFVLFHLYTAYFGVIPGIGQKSVYLGFILVIFYAMEFSEAETVWRKVSAVALLLASFAGVA